MPVKNNPPAEAESKYAEIVPSPYGHPGVHIDKEGKSSHDPQTDLPRWEGDKDATVFIGLPLVGESQHPIEGINLEEGAVKLDYLGYSPEHKCGMYRRAK
jgi:hypothetical protein